MKRVALAIAAYFLAIPLAFAAVIAVAVMLRWLGVPPTWPGWDIAWIVALAIWIYGPIAIAIRVWKWTAPPPLAGHCAACGYNLRGTTSLACPECGEQVPSTAFKENPTAQPRRSGMVQEPAAADTQESALHDEHWRPLMLDEPQLLPETTWEKRLNWFPLIGWTIAYQSQVRRIERAIQQIHPQLERRDSFPSDAWIAAGFEPTNAERVARIVAKQTPWPNHHFLPADPLQLILLEPEGFGYFNASAAIKRELGVALDTDALPPESTFGDLVAALFSRAGTLCHSCGYDLRATEGPTCPECGAALPKLVATAS